MSTSFTQGTTAGSAPGPELLLNGFRLTLSNDSFSARRMALPDNKQLMDLRAAHPNWFIYWREGLLYAVQRTGSPGTTIGDPVTLQCSEHLQFIVALIDSLLLGNSPDTTPSAGVPSPSKVNGEIVGATSRHLSAIDRRRLRN